MVDRPDVPDTPGAPRFSGDAPHYDVAGYVLGTLTERETIAFTEHLAGCDACRAEVAELGSLPSLLRSATAVPSPAVRQRTFGAIATAAAGPPPSMRRWAPPAPGSRPDAPRPDAPPPLRPDPSPWGSDTATPPSGHQPIDPRHAAQRPGPPVSGPASGPPSSGLSPGGPPRPGMPSGPPPDGLPSNVTPLRPRRQRAVRWLAAAAAALLVVAAVGIGAVVLNRDSGPTTTIALTAGDVGSGRGEAIVRQTDRGREVELTVSGLAANPPGTYYECWFVGPGDTEQQPNRVSAGTFTVGADGTATIRMISAADAARFPKMGVTLEPDDGNPARTGPKHLVSP